MRSISVSRPLAGVSTVVTFGSQADIALSFDPATANFTQSGSDLVISFEDGGSVSVQNFFAEDQTLPETFSLTDGTRVPIADFMNTFGDGIELMTAAGPSASAAPGSGVGEYADDAGSLIDGVDRLGSLGRLGDFGSEPSRPLVDASNAVFVAAGAGAPTEPEAPTNPEVPTGPESADQTYFMMIGHTSNLQSGSILAFSLAPMAYNPHGSTVALAGRTSDEVNTDAWTLWSNPETGVESTCYTFTSATGETMLYNPETGYFGFFPSADSILPINNALHDENVGYYYDFFTYQVMENGALATKYGHILYVNDQFTTTEEALAAVQATLDSIDHTDLLHQFASALATVTAFDGTDADAMSAVLADLEAVLNSLESSGIGLTATLQTLLWNLQTLAGEFKYAVEHGFFAAELFQEYTQELLSEITDRFDGMSQGDSTAQFEAALADMAEALAAPDRIQGSDSLCENYRPAEDDTLHIDLGDGSAPLIDYQFDAAGFEAFLDANPTYSTSAGEISNVVITATSGDDTLIAHNVTLKDSSVALGDGDDNLALGGLVASTVDTGSGNDTVHISKESYNSQIFMGDGDDSLELDGSVYSSQIYADRDRASAEGVDYAGDDTVTVNGDLYDSLIDTGGGNDIVTVTGSIYNGIIDTGDGDDIVRLDVSALDGGWWGPYSPDHWSSVFDGGDNSVLDHVTGRVGDILSFISADEKEWESFLTNIFAEQENAFKNFEALHLDLTNGEREVLNIDALLDAALDKQAVGEFQSLIVTGDDMDTLALNGSNLASIGTTTVEGMGNTEFTHYEYTTVSGDTMNLYVQVALQFI